MESRRFRRRRRHQSQMLDESSTSLGFKTKKRKLSEVRAEEFLGRTIEALYPSSSSETAMAPNLTLYGDPFSANTRIVTIVLEVLELKYEFRSIDVMHGDHLSSAFQKISPRGVVPTLVDGNFTLVEARAIATYLISQYANESQRELYPTITQDRARVDEMLYYDATVVNRTWQELMYPILHGENVAENPQNKMLGIMHFMNKQLGATGYVARTDNLSVADLAAYATVSTIKALEVVDISAYDNLETWRRNLMRLIPNYDKANGNGINKTIRFYKDRAKM